MRALWKIRQLASGWLNLMFLRCSPRLFSAMTPPPPKASYLTKSLNDSLLLVAVLFWSELLSGEVVGGWCC
jgi:hypothetical protein